MTHAESAERRRKMAADFRDGLSLDVIANKYNVCLGTVKAACAISSSPDQLKRNKRILELVSDGYTIAEIGIKVGVSAATVRSVIRPFGLDGRNLAWYFRVLAEVMRGKESRFDIADIYKTTTKHVGQIAASARRAGIKVPRIKRT